MVLGSDNSATVRFCECIALDHKMLCRSKSLFIVERVYNSATKAGDSSIYVIRYVQGAKLIDFHAYPT
jgi:hypothetical protein